MRSQRIVSIISAASIVLSSGAVFAQAERNQELLDQRARDVGRGFPNGDPRSGDVTAPAVVDRHGNVLGPAPQHNNDTRYAQHNDSRNDPRYGQRNYQHDDQRNDARYDPRYYQRFDSHSNRYVPGDRMGGDWRGRGAGPSHDWYRGGYLPREYRSRQYVVDDWRAHRLYAPPRGYHWVQAGGDYVLAAVATGVIAAILLNQ